MGWRTTSELDEFSAAAGGYLRSRAAENSLLLTAELDARSGWRGRAADGGPGGLPAGKLLFGWWEPPGGGTPRGAFLHDPAVPLLVAGQVPELAAALAGTLARTGRPVCGVDAPSEAADAFAAAWRQRSGTTARVHRRRSVYLLGGDGAPPALGAAAHRLPSPGAGVAGRVRVADVSDLPLLAGWISAFSAESAEQISSPAEFAAELIGYGGAVLWEVPERPARHLGLPHRRDAGPPAEPGYQPAALAGLTRPVAETVRISVVYTPPDRRRSGYAAALTLAVSQALLSGDAGVPGLLGGPAARGRVREIVMITDGFRPARWGSRLPYRLISERTVLRFGPVTGPVPRLRAGGAAPRLPTGPLPRLPRLGR
jgi:hypothetical protein